MYSHLIKKCPLLNIDRKFQWPTIAVQIFKYFFNKFVPQEDSETENIFMDISSSQFCQNY